MKAFTYVNSKGKIYYLHAKKISFSTGKEQTIYYFARDIGEGAITSIPDGYELMVTKRTRMPVLIRQTKISK